MDLLSKHISKHKANVVGKGFYEKGSTHPKNEVLYASLSRDSIWSQLNIGKVTHNKYKLL
jgi:hypothetical protein